jgi:hypothetical protein
MLAAYHTYLGDGVYASFDGYHIVLRLNAHDDDSTVIALEPCVLKSLDDYRQRINEMINKGG